jgi:hypothetical protein
VGLKLPAGDIPPDKIMSYQIQRKLEKKRQYAANRYERDKAQIRNRRKSELIDLKLMLLSVLQDLKNQKETGVWR